MARLLTSTVLLERLWGSPVLSSPVLAIVLSSYSPDVSLPQTLRVAWLNAAASNLLRGAAAFDLTVPLENGSNAEILRLLMDLASTGHGEEVEITAVVTLRQTWDRSFQLHAKMLPCFLEDTVNSGVRLTNRDDDLRTEVFSCLPWLGRGAHRQGAQKRRADARLAKSLEPTLDHRTKSTTTTACLPSLILFCRDVVPIPCLGPCKGMGLTKPSDPRESPFAAGPPSSSAAVLTLNNGLLGDSADSERCFVGDPSFGRLAFMAFPGAITMLDTEDGNVLSQNPTSLAMYGDLTLAMLRQGTIDAVVQSPVNDNHDAASVAAAAGTTIPPRSDMKSQRLQQKQERYMVQLLRRHKQRFLGKLFSQEPWKLGDVVADVLVSGGMWQGIVRIKNDLVIG
ncbi:hypothetical protein Vretifemale_17106, partial [Volvox reticuliferus]